MPLESCVGCKCWRDSIAALRFLRPRWLKWRYHSVAMFLFSSTAVVQSAKVEASDCDPFGLRGGQ
jgi:hypothetical protein